MKIAKRSKAKNVMIVNLAIIGILLLFLEITAAAAKNIQPLYFGIFVQCVVSYLILDGYIIKNDMGPIRASISTWGISAAVFFGRQLLAMLMIALSGAK
jgi:hypothetical protein